MQSYKLRKTSETALFPIEHELRLLRQDNDRSWTILMLKILSVVFSGVGTTLLSQDEYIPALVQYIFKQIWKQSVSKIWIIIAETILALAIFVILSYFSNKIINFCNSSKDNKKDDFERENLAEVYHKIILNNVITGKSFTKKAQVKLGEMQNIIKNCNNEKNQKENEHIIKETKRELCLYLSEAFYYFMIAEKQIRDKKIIEIGTRKEYIEFLEEVGALALIESLLMYEKSIDELKILLDNLVKLDSSIWKENEYEMKCISKGIIKINKIKKNILVWQTNLGDTIKKI